jgi:hypothetical protein
MAQVHPYATNNVHTDDNDDCDSSNDNVGDKQNADWHLKYSR